MTLPFRPDRNDELWKWGLIGALAVIGGGVRFWGLGESVLAVDEYYFVRSVENVIREGVPRFPAGGYYVRGVLQQYVTAPILALTSDPEWSVRVVPVLVNLAALPAVFLLGRRLGGWWVAAGATALFTFSMWEIEFARFGRMYALLQTLFLWQAVLLLRATLDGSRRAFNLMVALALLTVFVHVGAVFLWVLAAIPVLRGDVRLDWTSGLKLGASLVALVVWEKTNFKRMGTSPHLPEGVGASGAESLLPVQLPQLQLDVLLAGSPFTLMWLAVVALAVSSLVYLSRENSDVGSWFLWAIIFGLSLFHLFGAALLVVLVAWLCLPRLLTGPLRRTRMRPALLAPPLLALVLWAGRFATESSMYSAVKALVNYPPFVPNLLDQWAAPMPRTTAVIVVLLAGRLGYELIGNRLEGEDWSKSWRVLTASALLAAAVMALVETGLQTSRYSFFLYGLVLVLSWEAAARLIRALNLGRVPSLGALVAVFGLFFLASEDHSVSYLVRVNDPEVRYRTAFHWDVAAHLYPRRELRSPAKYVNERLGPDDIVVSGVTAVVYYLDRIDYRYVPYWSYNFSAVSTLRGTRELWTNAPLLWRQEHVDNLLNRGKTVWLLLPGDPRDIRGDREEAWRQSLSRWRVYVSRDSTVHVFRLPGEMNNLLP